MDTEFKCPHIWGKHCRRQSHQLDFHQGQHEICLVTKYKQIRRALSVSIGYQFACKV